MQNVSQNFEADKTQIIIDKRENSGYIDEGRRSMGNMWQCKR